MVIGKTFGSANDRLLRPILAEDDKWITLHPGGKGPKTDGSGNKKGVPCLIDDKGYVKGGLGGHFNGVHVKDIGKKSREARAAKSSSAAKAGMSVKKPVAPKKFEVKPSTAPEIPRPATKSTTPPDESAFTKDFRFEAAARVKGALIAAELAHDPSVSEDVKNANRMGARDLDIFKTRMEIKDEVGKIPPVQSPTKLPWGCDRLGKGKLKLFGGQVVDEADVTLSSKGYVIAVTDKVLDDHPYLCDLVNPKRTAEETAKLCADREKGKAAEEKFMRERGFVPYEADPDLGSITVGSKIELPAETPTLDHESDYYSVVSISGYQDSGSDDGTIRVYISKVEDEEAQVPEGYNALGWHATVPKKNSYNWEFPSDQLKEALRTPKQFASVSKVKEVNSPLTSMVELSTPLQITRSTARAVQVTSPTDGKSIWIPKSCIDVKGDEVRSVKKSMFFEKFPADFGVSTKKERQAAEQALASYDRPPVGFSEMPYPKAIVRETDKAVGITRQRGDETELEWYPKSQVITHSGHVIFVSSSILRSKRLSGYYR